MDNLGIVPIRVPGDIRFGSRSTELLTEVLGNGVERVMILTDRGVRASGLINAPLEQLDKAGISYTVFDEVPPEPGAKAVEALAEKVRDIPFQAIAAIGGGSVLDTAKLLGVLYSSEYTLSDLLEHPELARKRLRTILIPTTAGTGSEATPNSIVTIEERALKHGIVSPALIADSVLLDPLNLRSLPPALVASTGMDALAHAVESCTSRKANPVSDTFSHSAATLIFRNLEAVFRNPAGNAAGDMLLGSFYAGIAIACSGTTAAHALSYPLGGRFHVPHGVANAMLLGHVLEYNLSHCTPQLAALCDSAFPEFFGETQQYKASYVIQQVKKLAEVCEIPATLAKYSVTQKDVPELSRSATKVTRLLDNNRRVLNEEDIAKLYQTLL